MRQGEHDSRFQGLVLSIRSSGRVNSFWRAARRTAGFIAASALVIATLNGVAGWAIFSNASEDAVSPVDAVVVLGGEHDGRERYGLALAQHGFASTVVISDPYPAADRLMRQICHNDVVEVICAKPDPSTTRGEAIMTRRLAMEHHWKKIFIVTWRYHLPRARLIFNQCLSNIGVLITAKGVPRQYVVPMWYWQYIYLYQFAGIAKALSTDRC